MKYLISGASGFIGSSLKKILKDNRHEVLSLVREKPKNEEEVFWDPKHSVLDLKEIEGVNVVINLAGESIMGRWSDQKKEKILQSRLQATNLLVDSMIKMKNIPSTFISASAIGYYGNRNGELLNESSNSGEGFLAEVCREWEKATLRASQNEIRTINLRLGIVLDEKGGALRQMLTPFKLGLGGRLGSGHQYMSWITLNDLLSMILFIVKNSTINGVVNAVSPNPITNKEFTRILAEVLHRPAFMHIPKWLLKSIFGEAGEELFLSSLRVIPEKMLKANYNFLDSNLEHALQGLLWSDS